MRDFQNAELSTQLTAFQHSKKRAILNHNSEQEKGRRLIRPPLSVVAGSSGSQTFLPTASKRVRCSTGTSLNGTGSTTRQNNNENRKAGNITDQKIDLFSNVGRTLLSNQSHVLLSFLHFLDGDTLIQQFFLRDECNLLVDRYLLAMVYIYFNRSSLTCPQDMTRDNFFLFLYVAHDSEEDDEDLKYEIFPWALGNRWREKIRDFLLRRDNLWKQMNYCCTVNRLTCEEVILLCPGHPYWDRIRLQHHGGAFRKYGKEQVGYPRGPKAPQKTCYLCLDYQLNELPTLTESSLGSTVSSMSTITIPNLSSTGNSILLECSLPDSDSTFDSGATRKATVKPNTHWPSNTSSTTGSAAFIPEATFGCHKDDVGLPTENPSVLQSCVYAQLAPPAECKTMSMPSVSSGVPPAAAAASRTNMKQNVKVITRKKNNTLMPSREMHSSQLSADALSGMKSAWDEIDHRIPPSWNNPNVQCKSSRCNGRRLVTPYVGPIQSATTLLDLAGSEEETVAAEEAHRVHSSDRQKRTRVASKSGNGGKQL